MNSSRHVYSYRLYQVSGTLCPQLFHKLSSIHMGSFSENIFDMTVTDARTITAVHILYTIVPTKHVL